MFLMNNASKKKKAVLRIIQFSSLFTFLVKVPKAACKSKNMEKGEQNTYTQTKDET